MQTSSARHMTHTAYIGRHARAIAAWAMAACIIPAAFGDTITQYTITLTDSSTAATVATGSFSYDSTLPGFSAFTITDIATGNILNLTTNANTAINTQGTDCAGTFWQSGLTSEADPAAAYNLLGHNCIGQTKPTYSGTIATITGDPGFEAIDFQETDSHTPGIDVTDLGAYVGSPTQIENQEAISWNIAPVLPVSAPEPSSAITLSSALLALAFLVGKAKSSGPKTGKSNDPLTFRKEEIRILSDGGAE